MADDTQSDKRQDTENEEQTGKDGKPFDAARAQATIETLRASENDLKKQLKDGSKKLSDLEARLAAFEDRDKSETEKANSEKERAQTRLSEAETRLRTMSIRVAVAEGASAAGIATENIRAALRLLDPDSVDFDEDGEPTNVDTALKALVKEFPILAATKEGESGGKKSIPPTGKAANGQAQPEDMDTRVAKARVAGQYPRF